MAVRSPYLAAACLLLAACGTETAAEPGGEPERPPVRMVGDEVLVSCGGDEGWPPSVMAAGVPDVLSEAEARSTFQHILADPQMGVEAGMSLLPNGVDVEWRVLRDGGDTLLLGLGEWTDRGPGAGALSLALERHDDGWTATGWGDCRDLRPVLEPRLAWVEIDAPGGLDPASTELAVGVNEWACASGRDPRPFLQEPVVVESEESVTVYWTSEAPEGGHNCLGTEPVPHQLVLPFPLGDRVLLDGSTWPPRPLTG